MLLKLYRKWNDPNIRKGYRIISVEAADIYKHEQTNDVAIGYKLPEKGEIFYLFEKDELYFESNRLNCFETCGCLAWRIYK